MILAEGPRPTHGTYPFDAFPQSEAGVSLSCVRCDECQAEDPGFEPGWIAGRIDVPAEGDEPELAFFCPDCAEREFGISRRTRSTSPFQ